MHEDKRVQSVVGHRPFIPIRMWLVNQPKHGSNVKLHMWWCHLMKGVLWSFISVLVPIFGILSRIAGIIDNRTGDQFFCSNRINWWKVRLNVTDASFQYSYMYLLETFQNDTHFQWTKRENSSILLRLMRWGRKMSTAVLSFYYLFLPIFFCFKLIIGFNNSSNSKLHKKRFS